MDDILDPIDDFFYGLAPYDGASIAGLSGDDVGDQENGESSLVHDHASPQSPLEMPTLHSNHHEYHHDLHHPEPHSSSTPLSALSESHLREYNVHVEATNGIGHGVSTVEPEFTSSSNSYGHPNQPGSGSSPFHQDFGQSDEPQSAANIFHDNKHAVEAPSSDTDGRIFHVMLTTQHHHADHHDAFGSGDSLNTDYHNANQFVMNTSNTLRPDAPYKAEPTGFPYLPAGQYRPPIHASIGLHSEDPFATTNQAQALPFNQDQFHRPGSNPYKGNVAAAAPLTSPVILESQAFPLSQGGFGYQGLAPLPTMEPPLQGWHAQHDPHQGGRAQRMYEIRDTSLSTQGGWIPQTSAANDTPSLPPHRASNHDDLSVDDDEQMLDEDGYLVIELGGKVPLNAYTQVTNKLLYKSLEQAQTAAREIPGNWIQKEDESLPKSPFDMQYTVIVILGAIYDMESAEDNQSLVDQWKRTLTSSHNIVELRAWEILTRMLEYHNRPGFLRGKGTYASTLQKFPTFGQHLDWVCDALQKNKTISRHIMAENYLDGFVDDPKGAAGRVANNRKVNNEKKKKSQTGAKAIALMKTEFGIEDDAIGNLPMPESSPTPTPSNRTRSVGLKRPRSGLQESIEDDDEAPPNASKRRINHTGPPRTFMEEYDDGLQQNMRPAARGSSYSYSPGTYSNTLAPLGTLGGRDLQQARAHEGRSASGFSSSPGIIRRTSQIQGTSTGSSRQLGRQ